MSADDIKVIKMIWQDRCWADCLHRASRRVKIPSLTLPVDDEPSVSALKPHPTSHPRHCFSFQAELTFPKPERSGKWDFAGVSSDTCLVGRVGVYAASPQCLPFSCCCSDMVAKTSTSRVTRTVTLRGCHAIVSWHSNLGSM